MIARGVRAPVRIAEMTRPLVSNVSDTARWVATYRAQETARPDALFNDPFAERLAGDRGRAIAAVAPMNADNNWPIVMRTKLMDDLVLASVAEGCTRVLNLAAGFDTRPCRLPLPAAVEWIEADLPPMIEEKEALLCDARSVCALRREAVDLADPQARAAFLDGATAGRTPTLVLSEGLLAYLEDDEVRALARDLAARPSIRYWVLDVFSPAVLKMMRRTMGTTLANAPLKFAPPDGVAFFETLGWRARDIESVFLAAARFKRLRWWMQVMAYLPQPNPRRPGNNYWSAVVRLEREPVTVERG
jgi:methyltransferase (TIGR00027 family)